MRPAKETLTAQASGYPQLDGSKGGSDRKTMSPCPFWAHLLRQREGNWREVDSLPGRNQPMAIMARCGCGSLAP